MVWASVAVSAASFISGYSSKKKAEKQAAAANQQAQTVEQQQIDLANKQDARAQTLFDQYQELYMPNERKLVGDAFGNEISPARAEARATSDVQDALESARGTNQRQLRRLGVDPTSGTALALDRDTALSGAALAAGSRTRAREATRDKNYARQLDALSLGRGLPSSSTAATSAAQAGLGSAASLAEARGRYFGGIAAGAGESSGEALGSLAGTFSDMYKARKTPAGADLLV